MTRQHYGDRVRRTQNHWHREENGGERDPPPPGHIPFEEAKRQREQSEHGANGPDPGGAGGHGTKHQSRIKLVPFDDIRIDTSRPYLIKGLIPLDGLTVVWGPPKSGKSFWTFDLTMHAALGRDYRGRRVQQGPVVYCAFEGQSGITRRVEAFRLKHLAEQAEPVPFYFQPMMLDLVKDCRELVFAIRSTLGETSPAVVVLDTLNRSLRGSENSDEDMSAYIKAADAIREGFNCAVIIVHHCGVNETRPRGHTSLTGAIAAQLAVKRDANKNIIVTVEWMKDGDAEGVGIDEDGEPITSCVVMPTDAVPVGCKIKLPTGNNRILFDALIKALIKDGKTPPASNDIPKHTPCVSYQLWHDCAYAMLPGAPKVRNQSIKRAVGWLRDNNFVGMWNELVWNMKGNPNDGN